MKNPTLQFVLFVLFVLCAACAGSPSVAAEQRSDAPLPVVESAASFDSGGKAIGVQIFAPREADGAKTVTRRPAVLVVHGADGLKFQFLTYDKFCRALAGRGYVAILVHYFERTDTPFGDAATNAKFFATWMGTLGDAVTFAAARPEVDAKRIGMLGYSLGAYLSVSQGAFDPRVAAVVEYFGGVPPLVAATMKRMPPTLILHGDADKIVPVAEAYRLEKVLKEKNLPYEMKIYPGQGHGFVGPDAAESLGLAVAFFEKNMNEAGKKGK